MDSLPPPEDNSLHGIRFERVPAPSQGNTHQFAHPQGMFHQQQPRQVSRRRRWQFVFVFLLSMVIIVDREYDHCCSYPQHWVCGTHIIAGWASSCKFSYTHTDL